MNISIVFLCVYNGTFFEIYSFRGRNAKKDQELIIKGGMDLQISDLIMKSFASG